MDVLAGDVLISRFRYGVRYADVFSATLPFALFITKPDAEAFLEAITHYDGTPYEIVEISHAEA